MRYYVKNADGQELTFPTLAEVHALYNQGFIAEDDLVRAETATKWVKASSMRALGGVREKRKDPRKMALLLAAAMALGLALVLLAKLKM